MEKTESGKKGTLRVSENVVITIVKNAALEVEGVYRIPAKPLKIKSLLQSSADPADVSATMNEGVCRIALSIIVKNGYNVVNVCEQIQEKVKAAVQSMTGVPVAKVDVTVSGVEFDTENGI